MRYSSSLLTPIFHFILLSFVIVAKELTYLKFTFVGLAASVVFFTLLVLVAILLCLLLKARIKRTTESKDKVEDDGDPHSTLAGPRPSHHDIRVPKVKQAADSTAKLMPLAAGDKSSYMPLRKDDTPNGGTSVTFEVTSF